MSKIIKVTLLALILFVSCLCPFLYLNAGPDHTLPAEHKLVSGNYSTGEIFMSASVKNGSMSSPVLPLLIFNLFLYVFYIRRSKINRQFRSAIPTLRTLLILYPIKFQTNYIAQLPARL